MDFATSSVEADSRAARFLDLDPFPTIPSALLSSADIEDYARVTAMIYPFDRSKLKSASYPVLARGRQFIWHNDKRETICTLDGESDCIFPENSISFIELDLKLRLPSYIAARFNLSITHVHRGLLAGTGPLIDPGFEGQLLVPVHNLTATPYRIRSNKTLIWLEFTKTSWTQSAEAESHQKAENEAPFQRIGLFHRLGRGKNNRSGADYLYRANNGHSIRSSIPIVALKAKNDAAAAARVAKNVQWIGGGAALAVIVGLCALYLQTLSLVQDAHSLHLGVREVLAPMAADTKLASSDAKAANDRSQVLEQKLRDIDTQETARLQVLNQTLTQEISELQRQLRDIQDHVDAIRKANAPTSGTK